MITREQQSGWLQQQLRALAPIDTGIDWLDRFRKQARSSLDLQPLVDRKSEDWRYTSTQRLLNTIFAPPPSTAEPSLEKHKDDLPQLDAYRLVFYNGNYLPQLSQLDDLPRQVEISSLHSALSTHSELIMQHLGSVAGGKGNLFTAFNDAMIENGLMLHIPTGVELERPIQVIYLSEALNQPVMIQPRHLILLENDAKATLVEQHIGNQGSNYFHNNLSEIVLYQGASLQHYRLQSEASASLHLGSIYLQQQAASSYRGATFYFDASWARTDYNVLFTGEKAECDLSGLYLVGDDQLHDFHLDIRHAVPGCTSREYFKGIAHGHGRAVFDGLVVVEPQAQQSDAEMRNHNLILHRQAEIDTKPRLEIYADDVKCSHGTAVGQIEPEQMFYLRSRGIAPDDARRMLCRGFAGEIIDALPLETLRDYAYKKLDSSLAVLSPQADAATSEAAPPATSKAASNKVKDAKE